jgi:oligogalacturonide transport system permease protein
MSQRGKKHFTSHLLISVLAILLIYPLLWMVASSLKPASEIFTSFSLIPSKIIWESYVKGWIGYGKNSFSLFFINTFILIIPIVFLTLISSIVVAYGFARFNFLFKKVFFALMLSSLMLPTTVIIIPRYILFRNLGWLDTYLPFYVPALFAGSSFFIFMLVQFLRGIPKELDESAVIDGCNSFQILIKILIPLCKPALFSVALLEFIWRWNDFFNSLIYISSVTKYPLALGLRIALDTSTAVNWNEILAMSVVTMIPPVILFAFTQKYFVEGITTTGLKG